MELLSIVLFLAAIAVYSFKAGRNKFWFILILLLLTLFIVLNATLYASNYFTGDGINDAVLYTLTNSLTGAGVSKYVVPALGLIIGLFLLFCFLSWVLRRHKRPHHLGWSLLAIACAAGSVQTTPAFRQVKELIASHARQADSDFETYYKTPNKQINAPKLNLVYIYGESLSAPTSINRLFLAWHRNSAAKKITALTSATPSNCPAPITPSPAW